jgi:8-amino-7-oxononanoate synthase
LAEGKLAGFFGMDAALIFNSGYTANLGLLSCVGQRGDTIIYDSLCHASIRDGARLSAARTFSFAHNDMEDLSKKFTQAEGEVYIVVESIYSMDGDACPLEKIAAFCEKKEARLIVDEAHSGGIYGEYGEGLVSSLGLDKYVFAKIITYGKAFGSHGALVLGPSGLREFLINFSRPFIYTTALPPAAVDRMLQITEQVAGMTEERKTLFDLVTYFKKNLPAGTVFRESNSPIQALIVPGNDNARKFADVLRKDGMMVKEILSPTVERGHERIRLSLHSFNTTAEIDNLLNSINAAWQKRSLLQA